MRRFAPRILLSTCAIAVASASAPALADNVAHWATVIGIIQAGNIVGTGTGQIQGGGQPWSTLGGSARVDLANGRIDFDVRGLVLAGGNSLGTPGAITAVKGTLACDLNGSAAGNTVLVDTPLIALDEEGNARFQGSLGTLPPACTSESDIAFVIRVGAGRWIANGAVLR